MDTLWGLAGLSFVAVHSEIFEVVLLSSGLLRWSDAVQTGAFQ